MSKLVGYAVHAIQTLSASFEVTRFSGKDADVSLKNKERTSIVPQASMKHPVPFACLGRTTSTFLGY